MSYLKTKFGRLVNFDTLDDTGCDEEDHLSIENILLVFLDPLQKNCQGVSGKLLKFIFFWFLSV